GGPQEGQDFPDIVHHLVQGNVSLDKVMNNIGKVLTLLRPSRRTWIAAGADRPLQGEPVHAESFHGEDGLGGVEIQAEEEEWSEFFSGSAEELIIQMARRHPQEITLIALGPLTNLALALRRDAEGAGNLKEIVVMGGAVRTRGNITPHAEFNFYADPLAAKEVLESRLPTTLVPLDVTHQVPLTASFMEGRVRPLQSSISRFVIEATAYDCQTGLFRGGREVTYLHDPLAVGVGIDPHLVRKENLSLSVEIEKGEFYGKSREIPGGAKNVAVCLEVDREKFLGLFFTRLKG
ncbi:MAG: nucleoside hydrolase, partial [Syntrophaceae bacterium]|nr:nucleoside hydrolase [Syntrophaceae bacterium]